MAFSIQPAQLHNLLDTTSMSSFVFFVMFNGYFFSIGLSSATLERPRRTPPHCQFNIPVDRSDDPSRGLGDQRLINPVLSRRFALPVDPEVSRQAVRRHPVLYGSLLCKTAQRHSSEASEILTPVHRPVSAIQEASGKWGRIAMQPLTFVMLYAIRAVRLFIARIDFQDWSWFD